MMPLYDMRMLMRNSPWVLGTAWKHRRWVTPMQRHLGDRKVAEPGDDIVIEGYVRSANTFATDAFAASQDRPVSIATHFHSPAQFGLARKYKIPAMLLLRDPVAAALSYVVFNEQAYNAERALRFYIHFHRPLLEITDSFVVAPFEEVTSDFGKSMKRLNDRFGTDYKLFTHNEESQQRLFDAMAERLRQRELARGTSLKLRMNFPHAEKEKKRREIAQVFEHPSLDRLKAKARRQYDRLMALV